MNVVAILKFIPQAIDFYEKYGSSLKQIGVDVEQAIYAMKRFVDQHGEHPALTEGERKWLLDWFSTPAGDGSVTIGDVPAPEGPKFTDYFKFLDAYPDTNLLNAGDRVYQTDESPSHWVVTQVGVGMPGVPDPLWRQVWPL